LSPSRECHIRSLLSSPAFACGEPVSNDEDSDAQRELIMELSGQTGEPPSTAEMIDAHLEELAVSGALIDAAYASVLSHTPADDRPILVKSQESWKRFREYSCQAEALLEEGGSARKVMLTACLVRETAIRDEWFGDVYPDATRPTR